MDARLLFEQWNADIGRRKASQFGYAGRQACPQFSSHIGAALLAKKPFLRLYCPGCKRVTDLVPKFVALRRGFAGFRFCFDRAAVIG